jgi:arylsulfatase A-like enzyme
MQLAYPVEEIHMVRRLTMLLGPLTISVVGACVEEAETKPCVSAKGYNLVVICVDTLRSDHLGCYGYRRPTSPFLDSLAEEGVLFERALSTSSYTRESVAALMSGLLPSNNSDTGTDAKPPKNVVCMGELFQAAGYRTGFFTLSPVLKHPNFSKGFDTVRHMGTLGGSQEGPELSQAAAEFVQASPGDRFMLYVHYLDPHYPYRPPEETYLRFADRVYPRPVSMTTVRGACRQYLQSGFGPGDERFEDMMRRYDAEIAHTDLSIEQLFSELKQAGVLKTTLLVLTADHGEEFLEHNFVEHAWTLYQESIRVPLIFWAPGLFVPQRVPTRISTVNILPTVLDLLEVPFDDRHFDGVPLFESDGQGYEPVCEPRPIIAEFLMQERCMLRAVVHDGWKYVSAIRWLTPPQRSAVGKRQKTLTQFFREHPDQKLSIWNPAQYEELFDLRTDPKERNNLLNAHPEKREQLRDVLGALKDVHDKLREQGMYAAEEPEQLDEETLERLKSLGYVGDDE